MTLPSHDTHVDRRVRSLAKPEVQRLGKSESKLRAYQDEKLEIYHQQMSDMHDVFEKSRALRGGLQQLYEQWNKEILDRLSEIRADTDGRSNALVERLKDFASEFDSNLAQRKKGWRKAYTSDFDGLNGRSGAVEETTAGLSADIDKEREESLAQTQAETGPILEKLQEHRENLAKQVEERDEQDAAFRKGLSHSFELLKERIQAEKEVRTAQCAQDRADLEQKFAALNARFSEVHGSLKSAREEVMAAIGQERKENSAAQEHIVHHTMDFIHQFEAATKASSERQEEARKVIARIRQSTKEA